MVFVSSHRTFRGSSDARGGGVRRQSFSCRTQREKNMRGDARLHANVLYNQDLHDAIDHSTVDALCVAVLKERRSESGLQH